MHVTVLAVHEDYRLVRQEPSGEARVQHIPTDRSSGWLSAEDVAAIRADPASMSTYVNEDPAVDATNEAD